MANQGFNTPHVKHINRSGGHDWYAKADIALANAVGATCEAYYPGHPWRIEVQHSQNVVQIQLAPFMGPTNWYKIGIPGLKDDPQHLRIRRACGEILERYKIPRNRFDVDHFLAAKAAIPLHRRFHGYLPG